MKNYVQLTLLALTLCFLAPSAAHAQDYKSAVGLRLGSPWAASYKTFLSESSAVEAYVGYRGFLFYNAINLNGAYLLHKQLGETEGLRWYYGGGAGVQFWSFSGFNESRTYFTVSGYLGLEYTFADTPVSISVDWVPTFVIGDQFSGIGDTGIRFGYGNLAVRYVLGRE